MSHTPAIRSFLALVFSFMMKINRNGAATAMATFLAISRTPWTVRTSGPRLPTTTAVLSPVSQPGNHFFHIFSRLLIHGGRDWKGSVAQLAMSGPTDEEPQEEGVLRDAAGDSLPVSTGIGGISREYFIVGGWVGLLGLGYSKGYQDQRAYRVRKRKLFKSIGSDGDGFRDILEVGVGGNSKVGGFSNLDYYRPGQRIVGVDPALSGKPSLDLELAQKKATEKRLSLRGVGGVAEHLPFESGSFDAVVSTLVFCSVRDPVAALREVSRVLRPGGKFLFVEHIHAPEEGLSIFGLRQQQDLLDPLQQALADGCHLTRETDRLIRDASSGSPPSRLFSRIESFESVRVNSMWPVSEQVFGVVVK